MSVLMIPIVMLTLMVVIVGGVVAAMMSLLMVIVGVIMVRTLVTLADVRIPVLVIVGMMFGLLPVRMIVLALFVKLNFQSKFYSY